MCFYKSENSRRAKGENMAKLGIIALKGAEKMGESVNNTLMHWKKSKGKRVPEGGYIIHTSCPRFGSGESKGLISESIRGKDLYFLIDVCNHSITYKMFGEQVKMSPDDHYQDLKRLIAACNGKANRITVIMPFLYESRQHRRTTRESMDCALMLRELENMGVHDIITFDAHDSRVQNAIPLSSLENVSPSLQVVETLLANVDDLNLTPEHMMVISPDEGATDRAIYLANVLGVNMGMFYKRRDYTTIIDGRNPIIAHEFLGESVEGKDVIVIDDMISSGDSMIDVAKQLKERKANRIFVVSTFGLFTNGLEKFDKAVEDGLIYKILTTNCIYQKPELLEREWYLSVEMDTYIAALIDHLNKDSSINEIINPSKRIKEEVEEYNKKRV